MVLSTLSQRLSFVRALFISVALIAPTTTSFAAGHKKKETKKETKKEVKREEHGWNKQAVMQLSEEAERLERESAQLRADAEHWAAEARKWDERLQRTTESQPKNADRWSTGFIGKLETEASDWEQKAQELRNIAEIWTEKSQQMQKLALDIQERVNKLHDEALKTMQEARERMLNAIKNGNGDTSQSIELKK